MGASPSVQPVSHHSGLAGEPQKHHNGADIEKELCASWLWDSPLLVGLKECDGLLGITPYGAMEHGLCALRVSSAQLTEVSQMSAEQEFVDSRRGLEAPNKQEGAWPHAGHKLCFSVSTGCGQLQHLLRVWKSHKEQTSYLLASQHAALSAKYSFSIL